MATYYVSNKFGLDINPGTELLPFKNIQRFYDISASGDICIFLDDFCTETEILMSVSTRTLTIKAQRFCRVISTGSFFCKIINQANLITFENFHFENQIFESTEGVSVRSVFLFKKFILYNCLVNQYPHIYNNPITMFENGLIIDTEIDNTRNFVIDSYFYINKVTFINSLLNSETSTTNKNLTARFNIKNSIFYNFSISAKIDLFDYNMCIGDFELKDFQTGSLITYTDLASFQSAYPLKASNSFTATLLQADFLKDYSVGSNSHAIKNAEDGTTLGWLNPFGMVKFDLINDFNLLTVSNLQKVDGSIEIIDQSQEAYMIIPFQNVPIDQTDIRSVLSYNLLGIYNPKLTTEIQVSFEISSGVWSSYQNIDSFVVSQFNILSYLPDTANCRVKLNFNLDTE